MSEPIRFTDVDGNKWEVGHYDNHIYMECSGECGEIYAVPLDNARELAFAVLAMLGQAIAKSKGGTP